MSELYVIEVVKDAVYRINGVDNETFLSKAEAEEHIKKVREKKRKKEEERKNIEKELQAIMERSMPKQDFIN